MFNVFSVCYVLFTDVTIFFFILLPSGTVVIVTLQAVAVDTVEEIVVTAAEDAAMEAEAEVLAIALVIAVGP